MRQLKPVFLSGAVTLCVLSFAVRAQADPPWAHIGGEVTGPIAATVVTAAVSTDTPNGIVRRDASGGFIAGSISLDANLNLVPSTASTGNVYQGGHLFISAPGTFNLFVGRDAGNLAVTGQDNAAFGAGALADLASGVFNTAVGQGALPSNTDGSNNTALGTNTLANNTTGNENVAISVSALSSLTTGNNNIGIGDASLTSNQTGDGNVAVGGEAGNLLATGGFNTLLGFNAMQQATSANHNIVIGANAGVSLLTGDFNVYIASPGAATESTTLRIGAGLSNAYISGISGVSVPGGQPVVIDAAGHLGTGIPSSARFKTEIRDLDAAADAVLDLRPVSFRYLPQYDPSGATRFGLMAEDVARVSPDLVTCDRDGAVSGVDYQAVDILVLRAVQEQQRAIEALRDENASLRKAAEAQQRQIDALLGALREVKRGTDRTASSR